MGEIISFKHWKTGKKINYIINKNKVLSTEQKTDLLCPFDKTPIIFEYDDKSKVFFCPNCNTQYSQPSSQEEINQQAKDYAQGYINQLNDLIKQERNLLEKIDLSKRAGLLEDNLTKLT